MYKRGGKMIDKNNILKVWFSSKEEWNNYIQKLQKKRINITKEQQNIILKFYKQAIDNIKILKDQDICPNCKTKLILNKNNNYYSICPNWKPKGLGCKGCIKRTKDTINRVERGHQSWTSNIIQECKTKNIIISIPIIRQCLTDNNLKNPVIIEDEVAKKEGIYIDKIGWGPYGIRKESKEQELKWKDILEKQYCKENVTYHQPIFYKLKDNPKIFYKVPDFIINLTEKIIVIEIKIDEFSFNDEQLNDYIILLKQIFAPKPVIGEFRV